MEIKFLDAGVVEQVEDHSAVVRGTFQQMTNYDNNFEHFYFNVKI